MDCWMCRCADPNKTLLSGPHLPSMPSKRPGRPNLITQVVDRPSVQRTPPPPLAARRHADPRALLPPLPLVLPPRLRAAADGGAQPTKHAALCGSGARALPDEEQHPRHRTAAHGTAHRGPRASRTPRGDSAPQARDDGGSGRNGGEIGWRQEGTGPWQAIAPRVCGRCAKWRGSGLRASARGFTRGRRGLCGLVWWWRSLCTGGCYIIAGQCRGRARTRPRWGCARARCGGRGAGDGRWQTADGRWV